MNLPQKIKNWFSLATIIIFVLLILSNQLKYSTWIDKAPLVILLAIGFGCTVICFRIRTSAEDEANKKAEEKAKKERNDMLADTTAKPAAPEKGDDVKRNARPAVIFGGLYSIVNGLGIAKVLEDYVKIINEGLAAANVSGKTFISLLQITNVETFRLFGFFFTQIPFLHGTVLFLFPHTTHLRSGSKKIPSRTDILPVLTFMGLLAHAGLFYFIGSNLLNFPLFIFFLIILFAFNASWLFVMKFIFGLTIIQEWIQINSITAAFLFTYFLYPYFIDTNYVVTDDILSNLMLFFVLLSRTGLDYVLGWTRFYGK